MISVNSLDKENDVGFSNARTPGKVKIVEPRKGVLAPKTPNVQTHKNIKYATPNGLTLKNTKYSTPNRAPLGAKSTNLAPSQKCTQDTASKPKTLSGRRPRSNKRRSADGKVTQSKAQSEHVQPTSRVCTDLIQDLFRDDDPLEIEIVAPPPSSPPTPGKPNDYIRLDMQAADRGLCWPSSLSEDEEEEQRALQRVEYYKTGHVPLVDLSWFEPQLPGVLEEDRPLKQGQKAMCWQDFQPDLVSTQEIRDLFLGF